MAGTFLFVVYKLRFVGGNKVHVSLAQCWACSSASRILQKTPENVPAPPENSSKLSVYLQRTPATSREMRGAHFSGGSCSQLWRTCDIYGCQHNLCVSERCILKCIERGQMVLVCDVSGLNIYDNIFPVLLRLR